MTVMRFEFEGEQLTVSEIRKRVPILSDRSVRTHLAAGRKTVSAMLSHNGRAGMARGGRIGRARAEANGTTPILFKRNGNTTA